MDKQRVLLNKTLVIGIILLFTFMSITPSIAVDNVKKSSTPVSDGNTLYVGGSGEGNYSKIQDAIDNATDGDTVFVYDDSSPYYEENIQVSKSINLIGEDKETTIIEGGGFEIIVIITVDNVAISGFTIQKSGAGPIEWPKAGIYNQGADNTRIYDNIIQNNRGEGICICSSQNCIVENNLIRGNGFRGLLIFKGAHNTLITHNTIRNNSKSGILGVGLNNLTVIENNILFNDEENSPGQIYGVEFISTYKSNINRNNFYGNRGDASFTYYGYTGAMEPIFYWFEFLKEKWKGISLKFNANYWNTGRIFPFELYNGWITIEGPFTWMWDEFRYSKYDWHPAKRPYKIAGWDIANIP